MHLLLVFTSMLVYAMGETMRRDCLSLTGATGKDAEDPVSWRTYGQGLDFMPEYDAALRISQITVCYGNGRQNLKGFSFRLTDPTGASAEQIDIPIMGKKGTEEASTCTDIPVTGQITKIVTSLTDDGKYVNAISF